MEKTVQLTEDRPIIRPENVKTIHILGICGSGMGAFARLLTQHGFEVRGSDESAFPPMSLRLAEWGIPVFEGYRPENLDWSANHGPDLVIVGNVIRRTNPEAEEMRRRGIPHLSFPEALKWLFLKNRHSIVVTGTHGKTTTTSLCAWLLDSAGLTPGFLIGGIPKNFGRSSELGAGQYFVVEGDEYDTAYFDKGPKFLHYQPKSAILANVEFDHADIYRDIDHVVESFRRFVDILPADGHLVVCGHEQLAVRIAQGAACNVETYGFDQDFDWVATNPIPTGPGYRFTLSYQNRVLGDLFSTLAGKHNVLNALAAIAIVYRLGVPFSQIAVAMSQFQGVVKRQDVRGEIGGILVMDDYAHHPTAVRETISAIRAKYPTRRLWALFEAESNTSRRKIFQDQYGEVLAGADVVILSKPLKKNDKLAESDQIDVAAIVTELHNRGVDAHHIAEFEDIVDFVTNNAVQGDVILGMSGRDFGGIHAKILNRLVEKAALLSQNA